MKKTVDIGPSCASNATIAQEGEADSQGPRLRNPVEWKSVHIALLVSIKCILLVQASASEDPGFMRPGRLRSGPSSVCERSRSIMWLDFLFLKSRSRRCM